MNPVKAAMTEINPRVGRRLLQKVCRLNLDQFVRASFAVTNPGDSFKSNWHVEAITHHLELVHRGEIRRLLITVPPRCLKSHIASVAFPAWFLGQDPTREIVCVSYADVLAADLASKFRAIMNSTWYRGLFPLTRIDPRKDSATEVRTAARGRRLATSVGGSLTGFGGDIVIIDDPQKAQDAHSEAQRQKTRDWALSTLPSRQNDPGQSRLVLVMQRLHAEDLAGIFLDKGGWTHLNLPAIAQEDQRIAIGWGREHEFRTGDLLHPEHLPQHRLDELKIDMGSDAFNAQYLQQPVPPGGRLFKREWFRFYEVQPRSRGRIVISWDTASKASLTSDYSVATVWLVQDRTYYLLEVRRGRWEFPDLLKRALELWFSYPFALVLIEDVGSGTSLIQSLRGVGRSPIPIKPQGDKVDRAAGQTAIMEAGQVRFPQRAPWMDEFTRELLSFPGRHDDQVDSMVQALAWLQEQDRQIRTVVIGTMGPSRRR